MQSKCFDQQKLSREPVEPCDTAIHAKHTHTPADDEQRTRVLRAIVCRIVTRERGREKNRKRQREKTATGYEEARNARRTRGDAQARTW